MNTIRRFKVLGMLSLPLAAIAVVAILLGMNLGQGSQKASADFPHAGLNFSIGVGASCDSTLGPAKCSEPLGGAFKVDFKVDSAGVLVSGYDAELHYTAGLSLMADKQPPGGPPPPPLSPLVQQGAGAWPGCGFPASVLVPIGSAFVGCGIGISGTPAAYNGNLFQINFACNGTAASTETISVSNGPGQTQISDENSATHGEAAGAVDNITISCTPSTATFTATPTSTPPPIPRVFKSPVLQNVFLTRQGAKTAPARCDDGTNVATLTEQINQPPVTQNAKGEDQTVAAFEFEVRFDPTKVCVNLAPAAAWATNTAVICTVQDKDSSTLEGIARIGCVTAGKGVKPDTANLELAIISVRPQPEIFSQLRPNQDNGQVIQILNQGCELADEQGHAIPIFSCEDADITFRFLEGDVGGAGAGGPDCIVNVFDTQQQAFRWGVNKGSLLYSSFLDLEPSGQVKGDGDIDIKDIQFVFGRLGSACPPGTPWPAQPPVNSKANPQVP